MDAICAQVSDNAIEAVLERVPKNINATYEKILETIGKKPQEQRELARRVLLFIAYSRSPIPIALLASAASVSEATQTLEALESSTPTQTAILGACENLISVDSSTQNVRFVHFSVQEYLTSYRSEALEFGHEFGHREIARALMGLLLILYTHSVGECTAVEKYRKYLNILNDWPQHLLAANLNSLPTDHQMITLTSSFFEKGPPISIMGTKWIVEVTTYFGFSPAVLALIFNLPRTYPYHRPPRFRKQLLSVHGIEQFIVIFNDNFAMHYATSVLGSIPVAERLFSGGYPVNYSHDRTNKSPSVLKYCIPSSNSARIPPMCEHPPLYSVTNDTMAKFLLDNGASVESRIRSGKFTDPLVFFASRGSAKGTQLVSDKIADKYGVRHTEALSVVISDSTKSDVIQILLDKGANPHAQHAVYGNVLQAAAYFGNVKAVQLLLEKGAGVNVHGGYYGNALQAAAYCGSVKAMRLLLDKGADINAQGGEYGSALQAAAFMDRAKAMQLLLDKGANVNALGGYYGSPLQAAAYNGNIQAMRLLLDKGADVNAQGGYYGSALQAAASMGQFDQIEAIWLLLDRGADVNAQGGKYGSALRAAAYRGRVEAVQLLLDSGADVPVPIPVQSREHGSEVQGAADGGHVEAVSGPGDAGAAGGENEDMVVG